MQPGPGHDPLSVDDGEEGGGGGVAAAAGAAQADAVAGVEVFVADGRISTRENDLVLKNHFKCVLMALFECTDSNARFTHLLPAGTNESNIFTPGKCLFSTAIETWWCSRLVFLIFSLRTGENGPG